MAAPRAHAWRLLDDGAGLVTNDGWAGLLAAIRAPEPALAQPLASRREAESHCGEAAALGASPSEPFVYKPYPSADELGLVPAAWAESYKRDAARHWDVFYSRNSVNAYKDRHYLGDEFGALADAARCRTVLELGCGVGNTAFPLLET